MEAYPTELRVFSGGYPTEKVTRLLCWMMSQILQKKQKLREEIPLHLPLEKKRAPRSATQKKKGREVMELGCASNLGAR